MAQAATRAANEEPLPALADLPVMALSRPLDTKEFATRLLDTSRNARERSYAEQALGIAMRELGDVPGAVRQLRQALADAATVSESRQADVEASLGGTLAYAGRSREALSLLNAAAGRVRGVAQARILVRRGLLLHILGHTTSAVEDLRKAAQVLRRNGDAVWEVRAVVNLAQALIDLGDAARADVALSRAESLLTAADRTFEAATTRHTRGLAASMAGHIPEALSHFDAAEELYAAAGARPAELSDARSAALLAAGLMKDALTAAEEAVRILQRSGASPAYRAQALVRASNAALATDDHALARDYATRALRLYSRQQRERGRTEARLALLRARYSTGERSPRLLREATAVSTYTTQHRMTEAVEAHLLAGQIAHDLGDKAQARVHLDAARKGRFSKSALARLLSWRAAALRAEISGRRRSKLDACDRGFRALEAHQLSLGAIETRAAATAHARSLAQMALRDAIGHNDPLAVFTWAERSRATALTLPPINTPEDPELTAELIALRQARRRLDEATVEGSPVGTLDQLCRELEDRVRRHTLRTSAAVAEPYDKLSIADILAQVNDATLIELVPVDGQLYALLITAAGIRLQRCGSLTDALRSADYSRFFLRRLTRSATAANAWASQAKAGEFIQHRLLGILPEDIPAKGPVVIIPPAQLASVPWGLLPALRGRDLSVAPSALAWRQAKRLPGGDGGVVLVAGPGLAQADAEVAGIAALYPGAAVLVGADATADAVLAALDGIALAHIAAHGTFRSDNPMFSSLRLHDGSVTVLDLQRLRSAPRRVILSSCDTGSSSPVGQDEMLGMANALIPQGTMSMLAAVLPVNDEDTARLAVRFHKELRASGSMAAALRAARLEAEHPRAYATAHAFVAFGAE
jgi:tetratricopeptide (TPR) repeat protein